MYRWFCEVWKAKFLELREKLCTETFLEAMNYSKGNLVGSMILALSMPKPNMFVWFLPHTKRFPLLVSTADPSSEHFIWLIEKLVKFLIFWGTGINLLGTPRPSCPLLFRPKE